MKRGQFTDLDTLEHSGVVFFPSHGVGTFILRLVRRQMSMLTVSERHGQWNEEASWPLSVGEVFGITKDRTTGCFLREAGLGQDSSTALLEKVFQQVFLNS